MSVNYVQYSRGIAGFVIANALCRLIAGQYEGDLIERSLFLLNFHFHHRLLGLLGLIIVIIVEQKTSVNPVTSFLKGFTIGLLFDGVVFYNDYLTFKK